MRRIALLLSPLLCIGCVVFSGPNGVQLEPYPTDHVDVVSTGDFSAGEVAPACHTLGNGACQTTNCDNAACIGKGCAPAWEPLPPPAPFVLDPTPQPLDAKTRCNQAPTCFGDKLLTQALPIAGPVSRLLQNGPLLLACAGGTTVWSGNTGDGSTTCALIDLATHTVRAPQALQNEVEQIVFSDGFLVRGDATTFVRVHGDGSTTPTPISGPAFTFVTKGEDLWYIDRAAEKLEGWGPNAHYTHREAVKHWNAANTTVEELAVFDSNVWALDMWPADDGELVISTMWAADGKHDYWPVLFCLDGGVLKNCNLLPPITSSSPSLRSAWADSDPGGVVKVHYLRNTLERDIEEFNIDLVDRTELAVWDATWGTHVLVGGRISGTESLGVWLVQGDKTGNLACDAIWACANVTCSNGQVCWDGYCRPW